MIKKCLKWFMLTVFALICLLPSVTFIQKDNGLKANAASLDGEITISTKNYYSIFDVKTGLTEYYAYSSDRNLSTITLTISLHGGLVKGEKYTVKYRTIDGTAVAAFMDYSGLDGEYTFLIPDTYKSGQPVSVDITIYVDPNYFYTYRNDKVEGADCRTFIFEVYEVNGNPKSARYNCMILGNEYLRYVDRVGFAKNDTGYVLADYYSNKALYKWHITSDWVEVGGKNDDGEDYVRYAVESYDGITGTNIEPITNFADRWFTANYRLDENWHNTQNVDFLITFYGIKSGNGATNDEPLIYYQAGYWNLYNEGIKIDVEHDGADVRTDVRGEYRDFEDNWGNTIAGRYFKMSKEDNELNIDFSNFSDKSRWYGNTKVYFRYYDTTAPYATNWYLSTEPVKKGETLKLYLRMSEPVYITGDGPSIVMKADSGYAPDIVFNYVSGSMTDTLVFELDPKNLSSAANITSMTFKSITDPQRIKDFGENFNYESNTFDSKNSVNIGSIPCNIDTRTPQISTSSFNPSYSSAGIKKEHLVNFNVNKSNRNVVIKYEWSESEDKPRVFSNTITSTALLQNSNDSVTASASAAGLNGLYYLHITAENIYGNTDYYKTGPYKFDNAAPDITNINVDVKEVFSKGYAVSTFNISELPSSVNSGLDKIYMVYTTDSRITSETTHSEPLLVYDSNERTNLLKLSSGVATLNITTEMVGFEEDTKYKTVFIGYYAVDTLGNQTDVIYNSTSSYFDIRDLVSVDYSIEKENFNVDDGTVINLSGAGSNKISCLLPEVDNPNSFVVYSLIDINGNDATSKFKIDVSTKQIDISFDLNSTGYYELILKTTYAGDIEKYSHVFKFYLSDGFQSAITNNYYEHSKGQLLRNELYSLGTQRFYYKDASGIIKVVNYNNSTLEQVYSSYDVALNYIYFNELKDLYLFRIESNSIADSLNISDGTYRKAEGETQRAEVGQYWIRYKRAIWDNSIDDASWVYYYYGTSLDTLVTGSFSANLQSALNSVSRTIANKGAVKYLTDYSGTVNGRPHLEKEQIHYEIELFRNTLSGSRYNTDITFTGDSSIYYGTVSYSGIDERIPFLSDFNFNSYNKLFYMRYEDYINNESFINEQFVRFYSSDNLKEVFAVSGVYVVREIDNSGVRDFYVYVDRIAPTLSIVYSKKDGAAVSKDYDLNLHDRLYVYSFSIGNLSNEIDELAYITIRNNAGQLLNVYTYSELQNNTVHLRNGRYVISVYDRLGNGYKFTVYVDSKPLEVQVDVKDNYYIKVTSSREAADIYSYEIWLNQQLVSSTYSKQAIFEEAGEYRIRIEDLYGEVFEVTKTLTRVMPEVSWEYKIGDKYIAYGSDETNLKVEENENKLNHYTLYSSSVVRFYYNKTEDYVFNVIDATYVKTDLTNGKAVVVITPTASVWSIEIAYKKFPSCKLTYTGIIDKDAPIISSTIQGDFMEYHDLTQMKNELDGVLEGHEFKPTVLTFVSQKEYYKTIYNGETVSASMIKVSLKDSSKIVSYRISLNGKIIMQESNVDGTKTEFLLNKMGKYIIESTDIIGNVSTFTFTNANQIEFDYSLDGENKNYVENPLAYMKEMQDGSYYYSNIEYSHNRLDVKYSANTETTILVTVNGNVYYIPLYIFEGNVIPVSYVKHQGVITKQYGVSLFSTTNALQNVEYRIFSSHEAGVDVFAKHINNDIYLSFVVQEQDENKYTVEVRTVVDEMAAPFYVKVEMYGVEPKVEIDINGSSIELINNETVYISKPFSIVTSVLEANNISLNNVELYYSATDNFENLQNIFVEDEVYGREGFWIIKAKNIYGYAVEYKIVYSSTVAYFTEVTTKDGNKIEYSSGYNNNIYSNNKVEITIYTSQLNKINILKNGVNFEPNLISDSSMQKFIFELEGVYSFYVEDRYGNEITHTIEIKKQSLDVSYDIFTGWNEKALMKDDGYTNLKLNLDLNKINLKEITNIDISFGGNVVTLFNLNLEEQIPIDASQLINCIGNGGTGIYEVIFRDKFGNKKSLNVNYRETTTLELERTTRNGVKTQYDIEDVIANGFWSNDVLKFNTSSVKCLFKVDNIVTDCPIQLKYKTNKTYKIYYIDEYGFEHSFDASLFRQDIGINLVSTKDIVEINKVLVTKGNISLNFDSLYNCVYSIDESFEINYQSGTPLMKDGIYKIVITDKAGNTITKIIKRDTSLKYSFVSSLGNEVVNGEIVNASKVTFRSDYYDDVVIEKALLDGNVQTIAGLSGFTKNGKWEFVLVDGIGNRTYFSFYLMTYETSTFDYETPYNYVITDITYDNGSGIKVSYIDQVNFTSYCSGLTFKEEGTYFVVMTNLLNSKEVSFEVVIDNTPPDVSLVGCENNGETVNDVTFSGYKDGDVINIYKDGELVKSVEMTSSKASPVITDKGQYRIEIVSKAGNVTVLEFTRQYTANKATSILIISILVILSTVLFIGILYRRRARVD